jgi:glucose-1-phosphate thymidylyltransferase
MSVAKALVVAHETGEEARLLGLGFRTPALMPLANKPVLVHALERMSAAGIEDVGVVVGRSTRNDVCSAIEEANGLRLAIEYLDAPAGASVVDAVLAAAAFVGDDPLLVQEGDALVRADLRALEELFSGASLDALGLRLTPSSFRRRSPVDHEPPLLARLGACFLSRGSLRVAAEPGSELASLIARVRDGGGRVEVEHVDGCLPCHGGRETLLDANRRALDDLAEERVEAQLHDCELQGPVVVHPSARLEATLVRGPVVIGPRTEITHSYIGPYTSLGADVVIEGAEVENSLVLDGARIRYLGARLEGSVVGRDARIGRDHRLPHAVRLLVAERAEVTLA